MSITFSITATDHEVGTGPHVVTCDCPDVQPRRFATGDEAWAWASVRNQSTPRAARLVGCVDETCGAYGLYPAPEYPGSDVEVNVSQFRGVELLSMLGLICDDYERALDVETVGAIDAEDMLGRVLVAQALSPVDVGTPTISDGRVTSIGRPAGWTQRVLGDLEQIAQTAARLGRGVGWA